MNPTTALILKCIINALCNIAISCNTCNHELPDMYARVYST